MVLAVRCWDNDKRRPIEFHKKEENLVQIKLNEDPFFRVSKVN